MLLLLNARGEKVPGYLAVDPENYRPEDWWDLPLCWLTAVVGEAKAERPITSVYATELAGDVRQAVLKRRFDRVDDPRQSTRKLLGTGVHALLEAKDISAGKERRFEREHDGILVTGRIDQFLDGVITDYKVTSSYKVKMLRKVIDEGKDPLDISLDWKAQLQVYAWMVEPTEKATSARLIVVPWPGQRASEMDYPLVLPLSRADFEASERVTLNRIEDWRIFSVGREDALPMCDTWQGRRCEDYCDVNYACSLYQRGLTR